MYCGTRFVGRTFSVLTLPPWTARLSVSVSSTHFTRPLPPCYLLLASETTMEVAVQDFIPVSTQQPAGTPGRFDQSKIALSVTLGVSPKRRRRTSSGSFFVLAKTFIVPYLKIALTGRHTTIQRGRRGTLAGSNMAVSSMSLGYSTPDSSTCHRGRQIILTQLRD